jgi:hypothetical protein
MKTFFLALITGLIGFFGIYATISDITLQDAIFFLIAAVLFYGVFNFPEKYEKKFSFLVIPAAIFLVAFAVRLLKHNSLGIIVVGIFFCVLSISLFVLLFTGKNIKEFYKDLKNKYVKKT